MKNNHPVETLQPSVRATGWIQRLAAEANSLQLVETFLLQLQSELRDTCFSESDRAALFAALQFAITADRDSAPDSLNEIRQQLEDGLKNWRGALIRYDEEVSTISARSFLMSEPIADEAATMMALLRHYYSHHTNSISFDRFDLVIQRLFTVADENGFIRPRIQVDLIHESLKNLFQDVDEQAENPHGVAPESEEAVRVLGELSLALRACQQLSDLVSSRLAETMGENKHRPGIRYFTPEVAVAALLCNIAFTNRLTILLEAESDLPVEFRQKLKNQLQLMTSPGWPPLRKVCTDPFGLMEMEADETFNESAKLRINQLTHSLGLKITSGNTSPSDPTTFFNSQPSGASAESYWIADTAESIDQLSENRIALTLFREASGDAATMDPLMFLGRLTESAGQIKLSGLPNGEDFHSLRRRAFMLILNGRNLCRQAIAAPREVDDEKEETMKRVLDEMEKTTLLFRLILSQGFNLGNPALIDISQYVQAHLLESTQSLETTINRHVNRRLAREERKNEAHNTEQDPSPREKINAALQLTSRAKWLLAISVLLILGTVFSFSSGAQRPARGNPGADSSLVDLRDIPDAALLKFARQRQQIVICMVNDTWEKLSAAQKQDQLKIWADYARQKGAESITLLQENGQALTNASLDKVSLGAS
ncbi:MAG: hypothetical protein ACKV2V_08360 [Blastocatellia bacterium]